MNTYQELIKSFIIGSSIPSFIIFFIGVNYFIKYEKSAIFNYNNYSILAPLGLGIASLLAKFISINYNLKLETSYLLISILSALFIIIRVTVYWDEVYQFNINSKRGMVQYLLIFVSHLFIYNKIIYPLDVYL
tara:strand:- start:1746 stop:2144 length:399 start_codon:yes stop_codon:yes gene_type:complete